MKKAVLICITVIICVAIVMIPIYAMWLFPKEVDKPENAYTVKLTIKDDTASLPYDNFQILLHNGNYVLIMDKRSGKLYNISALPNGNISYTQTNLK